MPSYRVCSRTRTYFGNSGQVLAGGSILFYQAGTTTPQDVYGEKTLTTNNGPSIELDSSGRPAVDCWADTSKRYFMEVYDTDGVKQYDEDNVELPGGVAQAVPVPDAGQYLSGDGDNYVLVDLSNRLVPDPTGQSTKILGNNGTAPTWVAKPADGATPTVPTLPTTGVIDTTTSFRIGKMLVQMGSGTGPASGAHTTSVAITFATAYASAPKVFVSPTATGVGSGGFNGVPAVKSITTTGCTVWFDTNEGSSSGANIASGIPFDYVAIGVIP